MQAGFSLVEMVLVLGMGAITVLACLALGSMAVEQLNLFVQQNAAFESLAQARLYLSSTTGQAVNLHDWDYDWGVPPPVTRPANLNAYDAGTDSIGWIKKLNFNSITNHGAVETVAVFERENGPVAGAGGTTVSQFLPTAIYYQKPTPTTSGVIYVDLGSGPNLDPDYGDLFADRIVEFAVLKTVRVDVSDTVSSMTFRVVTRSFQEPDRNTWRWCPQIDITNAVPGCTGGTPRYRDLENIFTVSLRNMASSGAAVAGWTDQLYFFKMINARGL